MDTNRKADKIIDLEYNPKKAPDGWSSSPFCIDFVYTIDNKLVIIKGNNFEVSDYVKRNFPVCVYHKTIWKYGEPRYRDMRIQLPKEKIIDYSIERSKIDGRRKWVIYKNRYTHTKRIRIPLFTFKRLPKKWGAILISLKNKICKMDTTKMSIYM